jgi:hypothetical protein
MFNLNYNTYYHLNNGYVIKTLTKLKSNKVIHIERMPTYESKEDYFEQEYLTGLHL